MDLQKLLERIPADREEVLLAAGQCATAEELLALARSQGIELTPQEAGELLALIHPRAGELSPDELDAVTGGSGDVKWGARMCRRCGGDMEYRYERPWVHLTGANPACGYKTRQFIP